MRPTSEKAKSASKVSSRSHLGERVPRLRFPGFKGEWEVFRIKDILSLSDGDWIESEDQSPSGIRLVQTGNIGEGEFKDHLERARFISETTFHRLHCSEIFPGDCLISRLPDPIGRACVVPESCYRMITAVDCAIARPRNTKFDIRFFVFISGTPQYKKQMQLSITGSTRPRISRAFLDDVRISLPKVSEQSKIIEFLSLLDDCIAAQRKLVELLKKHKRGLLREVFEEKIDGDCYSFSEIASRRNEKIAPTKDSCLDCIELEHIEPETGMLLGCVPLNGQNSLKNLCKPSDIVFGRLRPYLRKFVFAEKECAVSSETWVLTAVDGIYPKFLFYLIQSEPFMRAASVSSGTKMPRSEWSNVANAKFYIPDAKQQVAIADCFSKVDCRIQQSQRTLVAMETYKRGLLQQLFV